MLLHPSEYLAHLSADGIALAESAVLDLAAPVPSCPGWDVAELVRHTGSVHRAKAATIRRGGTAPPAEPTSAFLPSADEDLLTWYHDGLDALLAALKAHPETPAYSWAGDHRVAFWQRRMAQETLVHRWDAENAVGVFTPIDAGLAADGVDELLRVFAPSTEERFDGPEGRITLRVDDADHAWRVSLAGGQLDVTEVSGATDDKDAEVRVSASAATLLLGLWRRLPSEHLRIEGDRDLFEAFLGWIDEA